MTTMIFKDDLEHNEVRSGDRWVVIHPLDDAPEAKVDMEGLGPMPMTRAVKFSLFSLRAYLVLMLLLVVYRVFCQAGFFGLHA